MHTGIMIIIDSTQMSTPLLHDTTNIIDWHFGLLSENFPLPSENMFNELNSDMVSFHAPCQINANVELWDSLFADEFFKYEVANKYMTSVRTFFELFMPYVSMHPKYRESILESISNKAIYQ
jgi:hypothetical protein